MKTEKRKAVKITKLIGLILILISVPTFIGIFINTSIRIELLQNSNLHHPIVAIGAAYFSAFISTLQNIVLLLLGLVLYFDIWVSDFI
jgi:hypothetical protein